MGTDELLKEQPHRFLPVYNELPEDLEVELSICISIEHDDPLYYADRLLKALPLLWIERMKSKLGGSMRITVDTLCDLNGFYLPYRPEPVLDRLNQVLPPVQNNSNESGSSAPGIDYTLAAAQEGLIDHIANLHL